MAVNGNDLFEGEALRPCKLKLDTAGCFRLNQVGNRSHDVIELHDLKLARIRNHRQGWQRRQRPEQRAPTLSGAPDDDGWAQNDPVEVSGHECCVTSCLASGESRGLLALDAHRGEMDDAPNTNPFACRKQGCRTSFVYGAYGLPMSVLQNARAVHDSVDSFQEW